MGTDIDLYVEVKRNGQWVSVDRWTRRSPRFGLSIDFRDRFYNQRNYWLFSVLADMRNNDGSLEVLPICDPKGLPEDLSPEVRNDEILQDCYSRSYLTLKELQDYPWDLTVRFENVYVTPEAADLYRKNVAVPDSWCLPEYMSIYKKDPLQHELITIEVSLAYLCSSFLEAMERLQQLDPDPNNVRIVFGFG